MTGNMQERKFFLVSMIQHGTMRSSRLGLDLFLGRQVGWEWHIFTFCVRRVKTKPRKRSGNTRIVYQSYRALRRNSESWSLRRMIGNTWASTIRRLGHAPEKRWRMIFQRPSCWLTRGAMDDSFAELFLDVYNTEAVSE